MHEIGITQSIIEIAERHAREQGASRVLSVTVAIGELSGVVADSVIFCFEACARGTSLDGARLIVDAIPGRGRCSECGAETALDTFTFACAACGGFALERVQGEELRITELEVE